VRVRQLSVGPAWWGWFEEIQCLVLGLGNGCDELGSVLVVSFFRNRSDFPIKKLDW
jgi:hypothetical protein